MLTGSAADAQVVAAAAAAAAAASVFASEGLRFLADTAAAAAEELSAAQQRWSSRLRCRWHCCRPFESWSAPSVSSKMGCLYANHVSQNPSCHRLRRHRHRHHHHHHHRHQCHRHRDHNACKSDRLPSAPAPVIGMRNLTATVWPNHCQSREGQCSGLGRGECDADTAAGGL